MEKSFFFLKLREGEGRFNQTDITLSGDGESNKEALTNF